MSEIFVDKNIVKQRLAGHLSPERLDLLELLAPVPRDPIEMIMSSPRAYSVQVIVLPYQMTVTRNGRFGFHEQMTYLPYPVSDDDPEFGAKVSAVLSPVIEQELWLAAEHEHRDRAEFGESATYEARDAVQQIS